MSNEYKHMQDLTSPDKIKKFYLVTTMINAINNLENGRGGVDFLKYKKKQVYRCLGFVVSRFKSVVLLWCQSLSVSWFLGVLVSWFLGFKVSKIQK